MESIRLTIAVDGPAAWPEAHHAVIAQPDPVKGESLILVTPILIRTESR